jgi:hypothetical protein
MPSLSVTEGKDGKVLVCCHKGCTFAAVMDALGLPRTAAFADNTQELTSNVTPIHPNGQTNSLLCSAKQRIVDRYSYTDEDGEILFQTVRYEPKKFRQRRPDGSGGWLWNLDGVRKVLYRLPELLASDPNELVFICEGEKDVDRLRSIGLVATCNPLGAEKWDASYTTALRERLCVLLQDNDDSGRKHIRRVGTALTGAATSVRASLLPDLPEKGDVSDWLDAGHTADELRALAAIAPEWSPAEDDSEDSSDPDEAPRYVLHHVSEALEDLPPVSWVIHEMIAEGSVGLIVGAGGSKKTYCMLDLGVAVASGQGWLTFDVTQGTVLVIDEESGNRRLRSRLSQIMRARGAGAETPLWYTTMAGFNLRSALDAGYLEELVSQHQPKLVVIDALVDVMPGGDENAAQDVHPVFHSLRRIANTYSCAVLVIHHTNKAGGYRGSTAMHGAVDLMLMVKSPSREKIVTFESEKSRDTEEISFSAYAEIDTLKGTFTLVPTNETAVRDFTDSEQWVLDAIDAGTDDRSKLIELAENCAIYAPPTIRKAVAALVRRGYLVRTNPREKEAEFKMTGLTRAEEARRGKRM